MHRAAAKTRAARRRCLQTSDGNGRWLLSNLLACQKFICDQDPACASLFCAEPGGGSDQGCALECQGAVNPAAMPTVQTLSGCIQTSERQDQACVKRECLGELDACFDSAAM